MGHLLPQGAPGRALLAAIVGSLVGVLVSLLAVPAVGIQAGVTAFSSVFALSTLIVLWPMDAEQTHAQREDLRPASGTSCTSRSRWG